MSAAAVQTPRNGFVADMATAAKQAVQSLADLTLSTADQSKTTAGSGALRLPTHASPLPSLKTPYVLEPDQGETHTIIGSGSIMRYLATARVTASVSSGESADEQLLGATSSAGDDAGFAVVQTRARQDEPVPAHFHVRTHDTFLVTKGKVQVWINDESRILLPGDMASVPPRHIHAFRVAAPDSEFIGIISPGSWVSMFNKIGEPYDASPTFPSLDRRPFPVGLFIEAIKAGHDVVPQREYAYPAATDTADGADNVVRRDGQAYFLRADTGPKFFLNGLTCTPMIDAAHVSGSAFSLHAIAGIGSKERFPQFEAAVSATELGVFAGGAKVTLQAAHQLYRVQEGKICFELGTGVTGARTETLVPGESIMIPAGTAFRYEVVSAYGRMYVFSGKGGGLEKVFEKVGRKGEAQEVVGDRAGEPIKGRQALEGALTDVGGSLA